MNDELEGTQSGYVRTIRNDTFEGIWHKAFWRKFMPSMIGNTPCGPTTLQNISKCREMVSSTRVFDQPFDSCEVCKDCDDPKKAPPLCTKCQDPMCLGDCS